MGSSQWRGGGNQNSLTVVHQIKSNARVVNQFAIRGRPSAHAHVRPLAALFKLARCGPVFLRLDPLRFSPTSPSAACSLIALPRSSNSAICCASSACKAGLAPPLPWLCMLNSLSTLSLQIDLAPLKSRGVSTLQFEQRNMRPWAFDHVPHHVQRDVVPGKKGGRRIRRCGGGTERNMRHRPLRTKRHNKRARAVIGDDGEQGGKEIVWWW